MVLKAICHVCIYSFLCFFFLGGGGGGGGGSWFFDIFDTDSLAVFLNPGIFLAFLGRGPRALWFGNCIGV